MCQSIGPKTAPVMSSASWHHRPPLPRQQGPVPETLAAIQWYWTGWSRTTHGTFPPPLRAAVRSCMLVYHRMRSTTLVVAGRNLPHTPLEMWGLIFSFLLRTGWPRDA